MSQDTIQSLDSLHTAVFFKFFLVGITLRQSADSREGISVRNLCGVCGWRAAEVVVPPFWVFSSFFLHVQYTIFPWSRLKSHVKTSFKKKRAFFCLFSWFFSLSPGTNRRIYAQIHRRMVNDRWGIMNSSSELEDGTRHKNQVCFTRA